MCDMAGRRGAAHEAAATCHAVAEGVTALPFDTTPSTSVAWSEEA